MKAQQKKNVTMKNINPSDQRMVQKTVYTWVVIDKKCTLTQKNIK